MCCNRLIAESSNKEKAYLADGDNMCVGTEKLAAAGGCFPTPRSHVQRVACCSLPCSQLSLCFQDFLVRRSGLTMHACVAQHRAQKHRTLFMVAEPFAETQLCPRNRLIGGWELLKESFENCRTNCNECRRDNKRPTKHSKLFIKK